MTKKDRNFVFRLLKENDALQYFKKHSSTLKHWEKYGVASFLSSAFAWYSSPQGDEFWRKLFTKLNKYQREDIFENW